MELFEPAIRFFWEGTWRPGTIEPRRRLFDCELVFVASGSFTLFLEREAHRMTPGMAAVIPPAFVHESRADTGEEVCRLCIHFDWLPYRAQRRAPLQAWEGAAFAVALAEMPPPAIRAKLPLVVSAAEAQPIRFLLEELFAALRAQRSHADILLWPVLRHFLAVKAVSGVGHRPSRKPWRAALAVKEYLEAHYAEEVGYPTLQRLTRLSKSHLCTVVRQVLGRSPMAYLRDLRLSHGRRLIAEEGLTVKEAAFAVGFRSANYFTRQFRRHYGAAPTRL
ncbi:MAG: helix-turn-helix domain-containing protein [Planctomycetota bacterium]|nr:helix-turn-helix domain-containing protein [Planctomycetota bacterium]